MDVIVTDHHELEGALPQCIVVTPKLGTYPCRHLAGVGVAFKLAHALLEEPGDALVELPLALRAYADVVAIGTIADIVPLTEENRVLAAIGLGRLRSCAAPRTRRAPRGRRGRPATVDAGVVGFRLAPRLNAAGRLEDASLALELLGSADRDTALPLALRLNELNRERQAIEAAIFAAAVAMVPDPPPPALVLSSPAWHEGVVGIVASRVAERFNRPDDPPQRGRRRGQGLRRSIPGFDLLGAVERSSTTCSLSAATAPPAGVRLRRDAIHGFPGRLRGQAPPPRSTADDLRRVRSTPSSAATTSPSSSPTSSS